MLRQRNASIIYLKKSGALFSLCSVLEGHELYSLLSPIPPSLDPSPLIGLPICARANVIHVILLFNCAVVFVLAQVPSVVPALHGSSCWWAWVGISEAVKEGWQALADWTDDGATGVRYILRFALSPEALKHLRL